MVPTNVDKVEVSWDDVFDGNFPSTKNPARKAWRTAIAEVSDKAKAALPTSNGRIDAATKLVLSGDVELLDDGKAKIASQSNGTTTYHVVNGECSCKDFPQAPEGFCKHRLAFGIFKRATVLAKQRIEGELDGKQPAHSEPEFPTEILGPSMDLAT